MKIFFALLYFSVVLGLFACGNEEPMQTGNEIDSQTPLWSAADLKGTWLAKCATDESGRKMNLTISINDDHINIQRQTYSDPSCRQSAKTEIFDGTFFLGNQVPFFSRTREFDFVSTRGAKLNTLLQINENQMAFGKLFPARSEANTGNRSTDLSSVILIKKPN